MTAEEHAHVQELEGLVKRYRSRIVELKAEKGYLGGFAALESQVASLTAERDALQCGLDQAREWYLAARSEIVTLQRLVEMGLTERDALQQQVKALQADNQIKDAAVEGAIRRAERAEAELAELKDDWRLRS